MPTSASSTGESPRIGRIKERGATDIDAEGHVVTPGFIDAHTHMDAQVFWDELGTNSCWHGVTTVVMGHCGFTLAPTRDDAHELVVRNLERAEDIAPAALAAGIEWTWTDFAEYLDAIDRLPKGINYAANIGHSALRTYVMGARAFEEQGHRRRPGRDACGARRAAMRAGAFGFTTSRTVHHQTSDDKPVASRVASWDEVCALVDVLAELGAGIFQMVTDRAVPDGDPDRMLADLALATGVPGRDHRDERPGARVPRRHHRRGRSDVGCHPSAAASAPSRRSARSCPSTACPSGGSCVPCPSRSNGADSKTPMSSHGS